MSTELKTGLEIIHNLTTHKELALLISAASNRILELSTGEDELVITEELKQRIDSIETRHARGEGKTYTKEEFRKHLNKLMSS